MLFKIPEFNNDASSNENNETNNALSFLKIKY